ncbi:MAG: NapC/NirT family cytochrome c [Proteobacteria bacterium]|nr:NapC/NirT family cytochrome c [Pseudomonadota bacterium]
MMDTDHPDNASTPAPAQKMKRRRRREKKRLVSVSVVAAFVLGILFLIIFNTVLDQTYTEEFCISCHEMKDNVYKEYQYSAHFTSRSGVRPTCKDCHLPEKGFSKILRKIEAANDVWHNLIGSIDTPEKFEEKRAVLAQREWQRMKTSDSQGCRSCHDPKSFDFSKQGYRSVQQHEDGLLSKGQTCIDCHKGIAHRLPRINQKINQADPPGISEEIFRPEVVKKEESSAK